MKMYLILFIMTALWSCSEDDKNSETPAKLEAQTLLNVSYGADPQQKIDIYLPERMNNNTTKVLFLVHGGGWSGGSKEDMTASVAIAKQLFPDHAFVNIGYRLATTASPAYPKQINDIQAAVSHMENGGFNLSKQYAFLGVSAGGHLSMLYSYHFDPEHHVQAICNIVGPSDFNDPAYAESPLADQLFVYVTSDITPQFLSEVSPITHINSLSAPTIQFMGNADPLVPISQGQRLQAKLDVMDVPNELHIYNAEHGNFSPADTQDIYTKLGIFFSAHF
ncbi:alpha/beta hydrolase [Flavobacterium noncentrifugens]|uniref:Acetyl esterase/lipase n=1 Tax=Flavobacterium noncentrifugens TaxID=1128970 RepID=A0A1G9BHE9_9FLAO|nr:alpha/beta hydrolase [Flavobacterium noncentrifugens]SDK38922.1 Acetyl esterase/lipase [Flavobacterium noncentrifugens]